MGFRIGMDCNVGFTDDCNRGNADGIIAMTVQADEAETAGFNPFRQDSFKRVGIIQYVCRTTKKFCKDLVSRGLHGRPFIS
jgi:hypothetical protein